MKRTTTNNDVNISFNSITEVVNYIDTVERTPFYKSNHKSDDNNYNFRGTHSMEEARELLLHGWDDGAKQLKDKLDAKVNLKLWVKVKKDWRDRDSVLRGFGFGNEQ